MNPKHPAIDRIEGPHDKPLEPYAEAILEPVEEVFQ